MSVSFTLHAPYKKPEAEQFSVQYLYAALHRWALIRRVYAPGDVSKNAGNLDTVGWDVGDVLGKGTGRGVEPC